MLLMTSMLYYVLNTFKCKNYISFFKSTSINQISMPRWCYKNY